MRKNLINNYRFLDFPQETSIEIKQGDFTPITVKLDSTETIKDDGKDAKVILINTDNEKVFETSVPANNRIVEFAINKNLPKGRYFLEIVYNQMKFPSKDYKTIIINGSASLGSLKEINIISTDDIKNRFISEAKKDLAIEISRTINDKFNTYITENQENFKGQSVTIANHEFDEKGNLNITFSDQTFIQIPKGKDGIDGKDGHNGENGRDGLNGRDGQSVTTITERGISNNSNGIFVRTYKVDHEGIKQDLISETFVSDGKDGIDGKQGKAGNDGKNGSSVSVDHVEYDEFDNTVIHFTDGKTAIIKRGIQGEQGRDGLNGSDGTSVGIKNIETDNFGNKLVSFTDGKTMQIPRGERGLDGKDGTNGKSFTYSDFTQEQLESLKGRDGNDGKQGADGKSITIQETTTNNQGDKEVHFSDGTTLVIPKGQDGKQGEAGKNGENGTDGQDGKSVTVTSERGEDEEGNSGIKFTFYHEIDGEKTQEITSSFIRDGKDGKSFSFSDLAEEDFKKILDYGIKNNYFNSKSETDFLISNNPPLDKNKIWIDTGVDE
ncbi:hypothetical protein [Staphylococcus hominis]|uniref:hypothetical protein n=1 Tax=Staphylococcus hominis TaxID=1290 RepID=UPI00287ACEBA|nr:hypothetical protein [Staphylococcus hominis]MDS3884657.1 hypothetical protein [Staphylococcus hominis]MDS3884803.1 hypothetical protein [Staphylococcus hominis]